MLKLNALKWWQTYKIAWSKQTTYRLNFVLQIIGPTLIFFFIKYNLWSAIFKSNQEIIINGYNFKQMISYHVWALIVSLIAQGHSAINLAEEIRMGKISTYLIYPFNFWEFHTASFLAFQSLQFFVSAVTISLFYSFGILQDLSLNYLIMGYCFSLFVSIFWFSLQYLTGILGFWLEETWVLRIILMIASAFLSGAILPLEFFPPWFVNILNWTPFPYLSFYPIKIFTGQSIDLIAAYLNIGLWTTLIIVANHLIWKKGIKLYTAAGM